MSISVDTYCIQCYLRRNAELARSLGTEEKATEYLKRLMQMMVDAPDEASSPWYGPGAADLLNEMYGLPIDRFHDEKIQSNQFVLERMPHIRELVEAAADPVFAGLQFAILGNYLDFAALQGKVSFSDLDEMLTKALSMELDMAVYDQLCTQLAEGKKLLYLTDNAGEIGFDRIFAEQLQKRFPHLQITFCVRGDITANDATREDAAAVGLPFPVIDNGNRVAGTVIQKLGAEAKKAMDEADVILAKGMGNAETMLGCGYNVYYAFLIKCPRFVNLYNLPMMTPMLVRERKD